jgi:choline dehydrogenase
MAVRYDHVIVGGGSAGSVLADRLSADGSRKVLVLEAGRTDSRFDPLIMMPAALTLPIGNRFYDWQYETEPETGLHGRRLQHARGRILGGSSSINGMIFQRGNPLDYERWAAEPGMDGWDYAHCLPYFRRLETCLAAAEDDRLRGRSGPLVLERGPAASPLFTAFFEAVQQAGYLLTDDVNGLRQEGFAPFDRNLRSGRRVSASRAYLHPAMHRPNLRVRTRCLVTRIRFHRGRATGVEVVRCGLSGTTRRGPAEVVEAGEVILCAGAFTSPHLLQVSGVGDARHLRRIGVDVVADLPAVGENLQDHLEVYVQHACTRPVSVQPYLAFHRRPLVGARWLFGRSGPGATNHFEAGGFIRSNDDVVYPNVMYHFLPLAVRYDGSSPVGGHGYQIHAGPMYSDARGSVLARSADITHRPALRFNYLTTEQDRREWVETIRLTRRILSQPAWEPYDGGEISPGPRVETDEEILDWVRGDAETALHPSCTCRMGTGEDSVVDPATMQVHGLQGLRVIDASALPHVTNGNIYAPVMMLAEKASDLVLGLSVPPDRSVPFHRHVPVGSGTTAPSGTAGRTCRAEVAGTAETVQPAGTGRETGASGEDGPETSTAIGAFGPITPGSETNL